MNYHIEGVFHAEETMTKKDWYIWSDLTMKEIEGVKGIVKVTRFSIPTCPVASIDPRFSTDKVLGKLMELAQQKHNDSVPRQHCNSHAKCYDHIERDQWAILKRTDLRELADYLREEREKLSWSNCDKDKIREIREVLWGMSLALDSLSDRGLW